VKVRYTFPAAADLDNVLGYVTMQSPQGAHRLRSRIEAIERLLAHFPQSGALTRLPWLRRITLNPYRYLIHYEVTDEEVIIHAVRHASRNPASMPGGA
jgi:toxin ParE1/3/4